VDAKTDHGEEDGAINPHKPFTDALTHLRTVREEPLLDTKLQTSLVQPAAEHPKSLMSTLRKIGALPTPLLTGEATGLLSSPSTQE
jgi:hypothetical protein